MPASAASILRARSPRPASSRSSRRRTFRARTTSRRSAATSRCCRLSIVEYEGQPVAAIAATTLDQARAAAKLVDVDYEPLPAVLTIEDAIAREQYVSPPQIMVRGDVAAALADAPHRLNGELRCGGQDHFYLEGQIALATPGDDGDDVRGSAPPSIRPRCSTASRICSACRSTP